MEETHNSSTQLQDDINRFRVVIRVRPFQEDELVTRKGKQQCTQFATDGQTLSLIRPNFNQREFEFDEVLNMNSDQETVHDHVAVPVLRDILHGFNGVIMAYGQTGSGKTHTIFGSRPSIDSMTKHELHYQSGIVPRIAEDLFDYIKENPNKAQFRVTVSFLEIYMEMITDLLQQYSSSGTKAHGSGARSQSPIKHSNSNLSTSSSQNLQIREDPKTGIFVHGLTQISIKSKDQLLELVKQGARRRTTNSTSMNKASSRSHAVLQIFVEQRWIETTTQNNQSAQKDSQNQLKRRHQKKALLTVVDLAGSERLSKTGSEGMRLQEAKNINKSIASLSMCISALASGKNNGEHVPFRDSKLTRLLTESLRGNSKTTICACVSPSLVHYEESYSTLLFAARAMSVKTFVTMNEKVEYKIVDEQGRSVQSSNPLGTTGSLNSENEKVLRQRNSQLLDQQERLQNEVHRLKAELKKQQSQVAPQSTGINVNSSFDAANTNSNQGGAFHNMSKASHQAWGGLQSTAPPMPRSQSPNPSHSYNPLMHQFPVPALYGSPQRMGFPHQDSDSIHYFQLDGNSVNNSYSMMNHNVPQGAHQMSTTNALVGLNINLGQQQQKDSALIQKLVTLVKSTQDELARQIVGNEALKSENAGLKSQITALNNSPSRYQSQQSNNSLVNSQNSYLQNAPLPTFQSVMETILNDPQLQKVMFDRLMQAQRSLK